MAWLGRERDRAARVDDFVKALKQLHEDFSWPYPVHADLVSKSISNGKKYNMLLMIKFNFYKHLQLKCFLSLIILFFVRIVDVAIFIEN